MIGLFIGFACGVISTVMVFIVVPSALFVVLALMIKAGVKDDGG